LGIHALCIRMNSTESRFLKDKLAQYQNDVLSREEREIIDQWFNKHLALAASEFPLAEQASEQLRFELLSRIKAGATKEELQKVSENNTSLQDKKIYRLAYKWWGIACSLILVSGFFIIYQYQVSGQKQASQTAGQTFHTANGKTQQIRLKDGTEIWMNAGTTIRIGSGFNKSKIRQVYLDQGEAFFKVSRDTLRPFRIATKNMLTTVLGTSFNIKAYPDAQIYQVAVSTGKVKIAEKDHRQWNVLSTCLVKGQVLTYHTHSRKTVIEARNTGLISSWKTDRSIYADGLTMSQIGAEISRQYAVTVKVTTNGSKQRRYHLTLPHHDLKTVLQELAIATGINYQLDNSHLIINPPLE
jgi:transmembrane sensor